ncbi:hypothetical protein N7466_007276 [Penicillium verhagenii]|uniref:uncharacterized protein n=1 Tax=Penicillium verhagenii TaxID=1562060 RepID=UPI00254527FE|nr:uncharacterized protein N7466_007276 [Penicillium verhagenii]KAJ5928320.1 hypothetical protein N7466_007276 [Penicillium verhagenii]
MQPPQKFGIDTTAFSFSKPAINRQNFSLRKPPKYPSANVTPQESSLPLETPKKPEAPSQCRQKAPIPSACLPSIADPEPHHLDDEIPDEDLLSVRDVELLIVKEPDREVLPPVEVEDIIVQSKPSKSQVTATVDSVRETPIAQSCNENTKTKKKKTAPLSTSFVPTKIPQEGMTTADRVRSPFHDEVPPMNELPTSKGSTQVRKRKSNRRQRSISVSKADPQNLNEVTLFELLIAKIKQREENEAAENAMHHEVETQNTLLSKQNQDLRQQIHLAQLRLQKTVEESKANRSLLSEWKSKIRSFKQVVNELGRGYDDLRNEANEQRERALSLEKEGSDLTTDICQTKVRISQAEEMIDSQQKRIFEDDKAIAVLEQALSGSRKGEENAKLQLSEQKKRVVMLEAYIQNFAMAHTKQIGLMKEGQEILIERFTKGLDAVTHDSSSVKDAVLLAIADAFGTCQSTIMSLTNKFSEEQINVEEFTREAHDVVSRIGSLSSQFSENIEGSIRVNNGVAKTLRAKIEEIQCLLGPKSSMMTRLDQCDSSCAALKTNLDTIEPKINALGNSAKALTATESSLVQDLESFSKKLADAQLQTNNPVLEKELAGKFAENTHLQIQLHDLGSKVDTLQQALSDKGRLIQDSQNSLAEITAKQQMAESQNRQLEAGKAALRLEFETAEKNMRQEFSKRNAELIDQLRNEHEAELRVFQKEKDDIEEVSQTLIVQLEGIQNSLIEAKTLVDEHGKERKALLEDTGQQIQDLKKSDEESKAQLEAQRAEIEKFQELDAISRVENSELRDHLEQAQQKIKDLEQKSTFITNAEEIKAPQPTHIVPFAAIENQLLGRPGTSQYGESCDFAMLFMSDDQSAPTPIDKSTLQDPPLDNSKNAGKDGGPQKPVSKSADPVVTPVKLNQSTNKKRKGVNFEPVKDTSKATDSMDVQPAASQPQKEPEEHPNKVSKHIHKWTYSRIQSSTSEVKQEQISMPSRGATSDRRSSPKALVSASSAPALTQPRTRNTRGRRKGRGQQYDARFQDG